MKIKFLIMALLYSTMTVALTSNEVNQHLSDITSKINQVDLQLDKQHQQQQSIDNAIKYSDSAIGQSNSLLVKLEKQKNLNLEELSTTQNNLNSFNQSLHVIKDQTAALTTHIYQQIQRIKFQDQSILSGNDSIDSQRQKAYLLSILQEEQSKLLVLQNKIDTLNILSNKLQNQINRLNTQVHQTKEQQQQLQANKNKQLHQSQTLQHDIKQTQSQLSTLKHQQIKLNQLMNQIIAREEQAKKQARYNSNQNKNSHSINNNVSTNKDAGYTDNSPLLSRNFVKPINGTIALGFGVIKDDVPNKGVLFNYVANESVRAVTAGKVMYSGELPGFGKVIIIDHGNSYMSIYSGIISNVKVGQQVATGQVIATTGGKENQPLGGFYFELRHLGKPINPGKIVS